MTWSSWPDRRDLIVVTWSSWPDRCDLIFVTLSLWPDLCDLIFVTWSLWPDLCDLIFVTWSLWPDRRDLIVVTWSSWPDCRDLIVVTWSAWPDCHRRRRRTCTWGEESVGLILTQILLFNLKCNYLNETISIRTFFFMNVSFYYISCFVTKANFTLANDHISVG